MNTFRIAKQTIGENAVLILCLTCFWAFHYVVFWSGSFTIGNPTADLDLTSDFIWLIAVTCNALSLLVFYLLLKARSVINFKRLSIVAFALSSCGIALIALRVANIGIVWDLAYLSGTVFLGMGTGIFMACLADIISKISPQTTFTCTALAFVAGSLICLVVTVALVDTAIWIATSALPFVTALLYRKAASTTPDPDASFFDAFSSPQGEPSLGSFLFFIATIGVTAGIMRDMNQAPATPVAESHLFVITVLVTGACLFFLSFFAGKIKPTLLLQIVVIVISGAFISLVLPANESSSIAFVIHTAGFLCFVALVWFFCTYFSERKRQGTRIFISGLLANQAGQAIGSLGYLWATSLFGSNDSFLLSISIGMVYLLLVVALVFFANATRAKRNPLAEPSPDSALVILQRIAIRNDLTPREVEIGWLIAKGDSRAKIAEDLTVSQETVKTHTKHLYQKLLIHSRKELLELIKTEAEKSAIM